MDFNYQNNLAAFHVSSDGSNQIHDALDLNQQIFIMNLENKKIHKISFGEDNIYYPHFGENGLLYALKLDKNSNKYSVLEIDPIKAMYGSETEGRVCVNCNYENQRSLLLRGCEHKQ